jgi:hypothetical protein
MRESLILTQIFHTDRDEETAKTNGARRVMKSDDGSVYTHCPRKTSRSTQHPSDFPFSTVDRDEISGLPLDSRKMEWEEGALYFIGNKLCQLRI